MTMEVAEAIEERLGRAAGVALAFMVKQHRNRCLLCRGVLTDVDPASPTRGMPVECVVRVLESTLCSMLVSVLQQDEELKRLREQVDELRRPVNS